MSSGCHNKHTISVLILCLDFFLFSEVATMWQIDSTAYKLKPSVIVQFAMGLTLGLGLGTEIGQ